MSCRTFLVKLMTWHSVCAVLKPGTVLIAIWGHIGIGHCIESNPRFVLVKWGTISVGKLIVLIAGTPVQ